MLDDISLKLLNAVVNECNGNGYKVFDFLELVPLVYKNSNGKDVAIKQNVELLAKGGFISVKYIDESKVCLAVLDKGRQALETEYTAKKLSQKEINRNYLYSFWGAFIGGAVTALLFAILFLIVGGK